MNAMLRAGDDRLWNASKAQTTLLPNGVRLVSEPISGAETVALGIWLLGGSHDERDGEQGFAHLLEHLWFRDHAGIPARIAALGGRINAHTGAELSFLHAFVRREDLHATLTLLSEMLLLDGLTEAAIAVEQRRIEREHVHEHGEHDRMLEHAACELAWRRSAAAGVTGARSTPSVMALQQFARRVLCGSRVAVLAAGAVEHAALALSSNLLSRLPVGSPCRSVAPVFTPGSFRRTGGVHETHLLWLFEAGSAASPIRHAWQLLDRLLRARLEQALHDDSRVVALNTRLDAFRQHGHWLLRVNCAATGDSGDADACVDRIEDQLRGFAMHGPCVNEIAEALEAQHVDRALHAGDPRARLERLAHRVLIAEQLASDTDDLSTLAMTPALLAGIWHAALPRVLRLRWLPYQNRYVPINTNIASLRSVPGS